MVALMAVVVGMLVMLSSATVIRSISPQNGQGMNVSRSGLIKSDGLPEGERLYRPGYPLFDALAHRLTTEWVPQVNQSAIAFFNLPSSCRIVFFRSSAAATLLTPAPVFFVFPRWLASFVPSSFVMFVYCMYSHR
jgi:hypothetical protein